MANLKGLAASIVKPAAVCYDRIRPPAEGVVVLAYHRVGGGSGLSVDLDPEVFAEQMSMLAETQRVASLTDAVGSLADDAGSPSIVVTFDDGTADFVEHALPALVASKVHATYYIATKFIEDQESFPDNGTPMTWGALEEAVSTGFVEVGSHTHSHAVMDKLSPTEANDELARACGLIEDRLGRSADHFAYPKGVFGGSVNEEQIAKHHRSAALADCMVNEYGSTNLLRLDRSPIQRSDGMKYFQNKFEGGMRLEGQIRAGLNRRRYQEAVH